MRKATDEEEQEYRMVEPGDVIAELEVEEYGNSSVIEWVFGGQCNDCSFVVHRIYMHRSDPYLNPLVSSIPLYYPAIGISSIKTEVGRFEVELVSNNLRILSSDHKETE